jgi:hypothetical protein
MIQNFLVSLLYMLARRKNTILGGSVIESFSEISGRLAQGQFVTSWLCEYITGDGQWLHNTFSGPPNERL